MNISKKYMSGAALAAALAVGLAGCGGETDPSNAPATDVSDSEIAESITDEETTPDDDSMNESDDTSPEEVESRSRVENAEPAIRAAEAALAAVSGDVISLDPEGGDVWSVLVRTEDGEGIELYVDATTGDIARQDPESLPSEARDSVPTVSAVEAIEIVQQELPEATIRELDLDTERGAVVWEILVSDDSGLIEFYVDAETGEILKQEWDD